MIWYIGITIYVVIIAYYVAKARDYNICCYGSLEQCGQNKSLHEVNSIYGMCKISSKGKVINTIGIGLIILALTTMAALRINVGNDYANYIVTAHEIYVGGMVVTEPGYNFVVKALYSVLGEENYTVLFALFAFIIVTIFVIAIYELSEDFYISIYMFMTLGLYFRTFNTVRYYLVLAMTLYSFRYIWKKRYIEFIIIILLAALFHKSALVVIPVYWLANRKLNRYHILLIAVCGISLILFREQYMAIALKLYPSYINTIFINQPVDAKDIIGNVGRCLLVVVASIVMWKQVMDNNHANIFMFNLNIFAIILYCCFYYIPLLSRFGYYLMTSQIILVPSLLRGIEDKKIRRYAICGVMFICILYFIVFLRGASADGIRLLPYRSWIFEEIWSYDRYL